MSASDRQEAAEWAVRCLFDRVDARSGTLRSFDASKKKKVYSFLTHENVMGVFVDCALVLKAGSPKWTRSLMLVKSFLVDVRDPFVVGAYSGTETARKIVGSKVKRLLADDGYKYLEMRLRGSYGNYDGASHPVARNAHRARVSGPETRLSKRLSLSGLDDAVTCNSRVA